MQVPLAKLDLRWVLISVLSLTIGAMLLIWQPGQSDIARTIEVTGEGTISAAPDEFTFYPSYQAAAATSSEAIDKVSETGNAVVAKLKDLGVQDSDLTTDVSVTPGGGCYGTLPCIQSEPSRIDNGGVNTATFSITAVVRDADLAQEVLNYLVTTPAVYGISPTSNFSDETRTELELQAREKALENAKRKAEQTVKELGSRLGKVVTVSDLNQYGGPIILGAEPASPQADSTESPILKTGTQELSFSITVTYEIR